MDKKQPLVVIADPDPRYQSSICAQLQEYFECQCANSLREAYRHLVRELNPQREKRPVLLTLELDQPDRDVTALWFVRYLLQTNPFRNVLIICLTKHAGMAQKIEAMRAGVDAYIVKPLPISFEGQVWLLSRMGLGARGAMNLR